MCLACRAATAEAHALCPACWRAIAFVERPYCERLGLPLQADLGPGMLSPQAIADPPACARIRCVALFDDGPARRMVHRLKYDDAPELARPLGAWMARAGAELLADGPVIVPVPMHRARLLKRRFNQAALLAHEVARRSGRPLDVASLARVKPTRPQVGLSRTERAANLQGAFAAPAGVFSGRRVLLIDDVATSGSTLNAAARAALRAGAEAVDALVFARVVGDRALPI
jgi:ComF family protein